MEIKLQRIKGIEYPSSLSIVPKKREYIVDIEGYYKILGMDPNEKNWGRHEIKDRFRKLVKIKGHDKKLIKAYKILTSPQRVSYDSLTKSLERLIEEVSSGKKIIINVPKIISLDKYSYYVESDIEENYELAIEWMRLVSLFNHRSGNESPVRVVLSKEFKKTPYKWGELVHVNVNSKPSLDILAYSLLKDTKENWYLDYCKIIRKWD